MIAMEMTFRQRGPLSSMITWEQISIRTGMTGPAVPIRKRKKS